MRNSLTLRKLCVAAIFFPVPAFAGSFQLNEQSVSGLGVAFAGGAAQAEDASTLFFNPAGIVLLPQSEIQVAANAVLPSADFHNQGSVYTFAPLPISGGNGGDAGVDHIIPNIYFTQPVLRSERYGDLTLGVGVTSPFGLETHYDPGWVGRYFALRTKLQTIDIQPTVAYRYKWFSIGAGLDVQYASARLTQAIDFGLLAQAPGAFDGISEVHGDDWSVGFTVGAIAQYHEASDNCFFQEGRFGVSYRSAIDHDITGTAEFRNVPGFGMLPVVFPASEPAAAKLDLPDILHVSVYQRFAQQFAVMGDIAWTQWSRLQTVPITFPGSFTPSNTLDINYDDSWRFAVGFEWYATKCLTFRTGFAYDETPIKDDMFRTPRIPDNDRYWLTIGMKWTVTDHIDLDLGYAHIFVNTPRTDITDDFDHNLVGYWDASVDIVSASVTYRWGGPKEVAQLSPKDGKEVAGYRK